MKNYVLFLFLLCSAAALRAATPKPMPMYIVNGKETKEIRSIPPEDIEHVEMLPADSTFGHYIARQVRWDASEPAARVVLRYKITPEGDTVVHQELESTDNRLKRRVLKAVAGAPRWQPALKNGRPIETEGVLSIQLPEGKRIPRPVELVIR